MVQELKPQINLRLKFRKVGPLVYVSHLDLVRTFTKVMIRAGLPLWYTEGFNPKPKLVFSAPLSIGVGSETEYVDIRLTERVDPAEAMEKINRNVTEDLRILEAYYPTSKLADLHWLSYGIRIQTAGASDALASACEKALSAEKIEVVKKGKTGESVVDIRPKIKNCKVLFTDNALSLDCVLCADPSAFLNPDFLIRVLSRECGILSDPCLVNESVEITRLCAYFEDMTEYR